MRFTQPDGDPLNEPLDETATAKPAASSASAPFYPSRWRRSTQLAEGAVTRCARMRSFSARDRMPRDSRCDRRTGGSDRRESPSPTPRRSTDPLLLFLVLGVGVFALDLWPARGEREGHVIEVTADEVDRLHARWTAQWGRPPTGPELESLIAEAVDEEILYREAQRLGLDREDAIVRRRLAQKLTFILEDAGGAAPPSAGEVEEYFARGTQSATGGRRGPRSTTCSCRRIAGPTRPATRPPFLAGSAPPATTGSGSAIPSCCRAPTRAERDAEIAGMFGAGFADAVSALPEDSWSGPVESTYGMHLVRVHGRTPSRRPSLDELRARVVADLREERRRERGRAAYRALRDDYEVRLPAANGQGAGTGP